MKRTAPLRLMTALALGALLVSGCATRGQLRRVEAEQRAALEAERAARTASEERLGGQITSLRTDVDALRRDLDALRNEFGTRITAMEEGMRFVMPVQFGFDEAQVGEDDRPALDRFAQVVQRYYPGSPITVEGFADPAGSAAYNRRLSQRRAEAVREYLLAQGLTREQLRAVGYGEARPVVRGAAGNAPGAELNRRVVFVIEAAPATAGPATPAGPTQ